MPSPANKNKFPVLAAENGYLRALKVTKHYGGSLRKSLKSWGGHLLIPLPPRKFDLKIILNNAVTTHFGLVFAPQKQYILPLPYSLGFQSVSGMENVPITRYSRHLTGTQTTGKY